MDELSGYAMLFCNLVDSNCASNLIFFLGASVMAAGGLTTGVLVFVVAAMLVSPIMGPILGKRLLHSSCALTYTF